MTDRTNKDNSARAKQVNLNQIPTDWITLESDGRIIINNPNFTKEVEAAIFDDDNPKPLRNGGCNCATDK